MCTSTLLLAFPSSCLKPFSSDFTKSAVTGISELFILSSNGAHNALSNDSITLGGQLYPDAIHAKYISSNHMYTDDNCNYSCDLSKAEDFEQLLLVEPSLWKGVRRFCTCCRAEGRLP